MDKKENKFVVFDWEEKDFWNYISSCDGDEVTPFMLKHLPKTGKLLEAGCGTGRFVNYLAKAGYAAVGVEYNQKALFMAKRKIADMVLMSADITSLPCKDCSFTGYISLGVMEHFVEGPLRVLREMYRILDSGGIAIITIPALNKTRWFQRIKLIAKIRQWVLPQNNPMIRSITGKLPRRYHKTGEFLYHTRPDHDQFFEHIFSEQQFADLIRAAGMEVIETAPLYAKEGIKYDWGAWFARRQNMKIKFSVLGNILFRIIGKKPHWTNHQYLFVARKS